jgi:hypothetical protein
LLRQARETTVAFFLYGTLVATWMARIPVIQRNLDLSNAQLGIALLALRSAKRPPHG